jgi:hypothetical protein
MGRYLAAAAPCCGSSLPFDRHSDEGPEVILNSEAGLPVAVLRKAGKALRVAYRYFTGSPGRDDEAAKARAKPARQLVT